ncbi:carnitine 3-dehydrogenase [Primorskyibacter sp. S187A]|uniref:carnitine 3-dehydrogenase n=1 Tax=Primorskyibacter sp. S187A TaxID=3415130 RepID=UPI003C7A0494
MKAAIIGGGVIGGGWAARFLLNGWDVNVFDPDPEAERKIGEVLANARRALPALYDRALPEEGALSFAPSIAAAVDSASWVQESVPERLEIKHTTFAEIQETLDPEAVIGSSTSGFKPSELQRGAKDPTQILVTHPFNPVYLLPLIEVVPGDNYDPRAVAWAKEVLTGIGMYPLHVRKEIDAHIADRFLEAVWREALWLVKDGVATTEEIDEAIRMGFGLRWAQMGLFETYRVAGGEAGMKHFMAQFGPALEWPWTKLMDVPEFTDELVDLIAGQSDAQSGHLSIRALERLRDDNLVGILRALKKNEAAAGNILNTHEATLPLTQEADLPITVDRVIPQTWTDYNGHMNEAHYLEAGAQATDAFMVLVGADADYIKAGHSYFTVENHLRYLGEMKAGERLRVRSQVMGAQGKKLHLFHFIENGDGHLCATMESMLLHVSLETRRSCPPLPQVAEKLVAFEAAHAALPKPEGAGRAIG